MPVSASASPCTPSTATIWSRSCSVPTSPCTTPSEPRRVTPSLRSIRPTARRAGWRWSSELRQGIEDNQLLLYYQPKLDLKTDAGERC